MNYEIKLKNLYNNFNILIPDFIEDLNKNFSVALLEKSKYDFFITIYEKIKLKIIIRFDLNFFDKLKVIPLHLLYQEGVKEYYFNLIKIEDSGKYIFNFNSTNKKLQIEFNRGYQNLKNIFQKINNLINTNTKYLEFFKEYYNFVIDFRKILKTFSLKEKQNIQKSINKELRKKNKYNIFLNNNNNNNINNVNIQIKKKIYELESNYQKNTTYLNSILEKKLNTIKENNLNYNTFNNIKKKDNYIEKIFSNLLIIINNFIILLSESLNDNKKKSKDLFKEKYGINGFHSFYTNYKIDDLNDGTKDIFINIFVILKIKDNIEIIRICHLTFHYNLIKMYNVSPVHFVINNSLILNNKKFDFESKFGFKSKFINKFYFNLNEIDNNYIFNTESKNNISKSNINLQENENLKLFENIIIIINTLINKFNIFKQVFKQFYYIILLIDNIYKLNSIEKVLQFKKIEESKKKVNEEYNNDSSKQSVNNFSISSYNIAIKRKKIKNQKESINANSNDIQLSKTFLFNKNNNNLNSINYENSEIKKKIQNFENTRGYKTILNSENYIKPSIFEIENQNSNEIKILKLKNKLLSFLKNFCLLLEENLNINFDYLREKCYDLIYLYGFKVNYKVTTNENIFINIYLIKKINEQFEILLPCHIKFEFNLINFFYKQVYPIHIVINELLCSEYLSSNFKYNRKGRKDKNYYFNLIKNGIKYEFNINSVGKSNPIQINLESNKLNLFSYIFKNINELINEEDYVNIFKQLHNLIVNIRSKNKSLISFSHEKPEYNFRSIREHLES